MSIEPEVWGFAAFLLAFGLAVGAWGLIDWLADRSPVQDAEPSRLDALDGLAGMDKPLPPICWSPGPRGGHDYIKARGYWTCVRCGDKRCAS